MLLLLAGLKQGMALLLGLVVAGEGQVAGAVGAEAGRGAPHVAWGRRGGRCGNDMRPAVQDLFGCCDYQ